MDQSKIKDQRSKIASSTLALALVLTLLTVNADGKPLTIPGINIVSNADNPDQVAVTLQILLLLTILSLAPAILIMLTSFSMIVVVLALLRQAMGT